MKHDQLVREIEHHNTALEALRQCNRDWRYRTMTPGLYDEDGNCARPWDPGLRVQVLCYSLVHMRVTGDNYSGDLNAGELTMDDLRLVMEARRVVDLWIAGEISDLPIDPPRPAL